MKLLARPTWGQRPRGAVEPLELMSCGVEKDDGLSDHRRLRKTADKCVFHAQHTPTHPRQELEKRRRRRPRRPRYYIDDVAGL